MIGHVEDELCLSRQARSIWAKSDRESEENWLPLYVHLCDSAAVAQRLWDNWLPRSTRRIIGVAVGDDALAGRMVRFLAGIHDLGKATPAFQKQPRWGNSRGGSEDLSYLPRKAGLPIRPDLEKRGPAHPAAGEILLEKYLIEEKGWKKPVARSYAGVLGAHHGRFPDVGHLRDAARDHPDSMGFSSPHGEWEKVQTELVEYALILAGLSTEDLEVLAHHPLPAPVASLVTGVVIMSDWMASNQGAFPLVSLLDPSSGGLIEKGGVLNLRRLELRANSAWARLGILPAWEGQISADGASDFYRHRFSLPSGASPWPVQSVALELARDVEDPGIFVIEAPMGSGKTETALAMAEELGARCGCGGVCVALPTMATTDAMFGRVHAWLEHLPGKKVDGGRSVYLAHGKAQLNEEYQGIVDVSRSGRRFSSMGVDLQEGAHDTSETTVVCDWMFGRKKGMLADFVVCTVDQVLMGALQMKHLSLRHLALANKVVIIDECHAYDIYMRQYLLRVLEWLGTWHVPVILLSATLPADQRRHMVEAYLRGRETPDSANEGARSLDVATTRRRGGGPKAALVARKAKEAQTEKKASDDEVLGYPLISYSCGTEPRHREVDWTGMTQEVELRLMDDDLESLVRLLVDLLAEGGCAGVVCDTVSRAQEVADQLCDAFGPHDVVLVHSRFIDIDRMTREAHLRDLLGPQSHRSDGSRPERLVVVGTQVIEQSLDIDFDVLVTDVAPVDLLLQRLGRTHRHRRGPGESERPKKLRLPLCFVRGVEDLADDVPKFARGVSKVYEKASLMESLAVLGLTRNASHTFAVLPKDIAPLVQSAYGEGAASHVPDAWRAAYKEAVENRAEHFEKKKKRAEKFLLHSASRSLRDADTLIGLCEGSVEERKDGKRSDDDRGQRAVRDTQETVEVLLLWHKDDELRLPPWVGDERNDVEPGCAVPRNYEPPAHIARVVSQCAVRLPISMCNPEDLDGLIGALEKGCGKWVAAWQSSTWLAGRLVLPMEMEEDGVLSATVYRRTLRYTSEGGLSTV